MVESSTSDLMESMDRNRISGAILIAHPPVTSNERVLKLAHEFPDRIIPAVNFGRGCGLSIEEAQSEFRRAIEQCEGALLLKIHAAADGEGAESPRYRALLDIASEFAVPVILHTGCIQAHLIHRSPSLGEPSRFRGWFADWPRLPFILAHMNMHDPASALDLGEEFENLYLDTSWQPAEVVVEAVRRVGAARVLFGSDWPLLGNNQAVALGRIDQALASGYITLEDAAQIRGENLARLLKMSFGVARTRVLESRARDGS
jgi:predicted TIM-barrel fold metal-dependent hydrolase